MGAFDRFLTGAGNAYQAIRSSTSRIPDGAVVYDPAAAIRWTQKYTPDLLEQIKSRRDLSSVIQLCDDMLTDDRLRSVAYMRAQALVGADLEFVEGEGRRRKRALRAADAEADYFEMVPEAEFVQMVVWGQLANFGPGRLKWWDKDARGAYRPRIRNSRVVPALEFWHPRLFRLDLSARQWIAKVETPDSGTIPVDRAIDFTSGEFVAFCPWGGAGDVSRGLWIAAAKLWLLKQYAIRDWATLGSRLGNPIKVIEYALGSQGVDVRADGGADAKRKQLVTEIAAMGKQGVISLSPGFTMKLLAVPATSAAMFKDQIDTVNTALAILFLGQNLTTEIKGGSLAAAQVAALILGHLRKFDANCESTFVRESILSLWSSINFGTADAAPWLSRNVEPPEDKKSAADVMLIVARAVEIFERIGWIQDKAATAERYQLDLAEGQANTVPKAPAANDTAPAQKAPINAAA